MIDYLINVYLTKYTEEKKKERLPYVISEATYTYALY